MNQEFMKAIVDLFYPFVEATVFNHEGVIEEIFNPFSTIKEDQVSEMFKSQKTFSELLSDGKSVRTLIYPIYEKKFIIRYLRLRFDLSHFKNLQEKLNFLLQSSTISTVDPWQQSIDQVIYAFLNQHKITLQALSAKHKRELIASLQAKRLFDFKESSVYVASKLQISRATVYNYLKTASDFKKIHVHQVDAFTNKKFGGNPAGVVLDAEELDEATMRKIARELNLSETAFVIPSSKGSFQMRYFTPTGHEIGFCGHSTVGALYMIAKEKRYGIEKEGTYPFKVETANGILKMEAKIDAEDEIQVSYETPIIKLKKVNHSHSDVAKAAGFNPQFIHSEYPVMYEETNKDLFVMVRSLEDLRKVECDSKTLAQFSKQHDIVALCLFCQEAFESTHQFHMRCFAPLVGIPEDPFTGSVLGGLAAYIGSFNLLPKNREYFKVEQGHFMDRPGVVEVNFWLKGKTYQAKVVAQAIHCFSTEIDLV